MDAICSSVSNSSPSLTPPPQPPSTRTPPPPTSLSTPQTPPAAPSPASHKAPPSLTPQLATPTIPATFEPSEQPGRILERTQVESENNNGDLMISHDEKSSSNKQDSDVKGETRGQEEMTQSIVKETSNIKLKRCKHGRIIVKDLSKKKLVQQSDKEVAQNKSINNDENSHSNQPGQIVASNPIDSNSLPESPSPGRQLSDHIDSKTSTPSLSNDIDDINYDSNSPSTAENDVSLRVDLKKEDLDLAIDAIKEKKARSPSRKRSKTSPRHRARSRSPIRSSPRRDSSKSPRERSKNRRRDRSPRRKDSIRSPRSHRDSKTSSSRRKSDRRRSPRRRDSPISYRGSRRSLRYDSPRRRYSRSRSRSRSAGRYGYSRSSRRNYSRSPEPSSYRRDNYGRDSDRLPRRSDILDEIEQQSDVQLFTGPFNKTCDLTKSNQSVTDARLCNKPPTMHDTLNNQLIKKPPDKLDPKATQPDTSPKESLPARSPSSPSSNYSASSDIYDPEGPILPISPVDSPPISPINNAAYPKQPNRRDTEKAAPVIATTKITTNTTNPANEDDLPSSAVQLNHQEKYLQKLNRQERVIEEVKVALRPYYQRRAITKEQYKDVLRRAVPKVCHSKNGEINPVKIRALVDAYAKKMKKKNNR